MFYYLIDFENKSEGLYTLSIVKGSPIPVVTGPNKLAENYMITSDPDLESFAMMIPKQLQNQYLNFTLDLVKTGKLSVDIIKRVKHQIIVGGQWEVRALLKNVHDSCFEFSYSSGTQRLYVSTFRLGEPDE